VTLTCQEDLDSLISLADSTGLSRLGFNIRLFPEPPVLSSHNGAFILSPDAQQSLMVCTCICTGY